MSTSKNVPKDHYDGRKGEIMKMGYLKKLKTMKKKYFILREESSDASARLEYYDNEKKWRNSQPPKRTISLKTCFNINRRKDTKHKYVIALYTKDDCFCIVLDSEEELQDWLKVLLKLQTGEECVDGEQPKPNFEHVWKVTLQEKGLGDSKNLVGPYHVCLTDQTLSLVKITEDDAKPETLEFPLIYIRSCGVTGSFFYIEVGRQTVTGAGALWMLTEDANIAKNMNEVIFSAFSVQQKDQKDSNPHRKRSSSATESSKPAAVLQRRQTHGPSKPLVSTGGYSAVPVVSSLVIPAHSRASALHCVPRPPSQRRHSVSAMSSSSVLGSSTMVQHQRTNSIPLSPYSESSETFNGQPSTTVPIVHQRTKSCPISETSVLGSLTGQTSPPEPQRNLNSFYPTHRDRNSSQSSIDFAHSHAGEGSDVRRSSISGRRTSTIMKSSAKGTRERSDSMPSRNRTTSEGGHHCTAGILPRIPYHGSRPHSMHSRGLSHSPPAASGHCSADSIGSLASIDDGELDLAVSQTSPRYGHSSTPDEPAIIEENCNDYCHWSQENGEVEKADGDYVSMERPPPSLSLPIHVAVVQRKVSAPASLKSSSPLHSFTDVCSPCGSSPLETGNYLPMSPGENLRRVTVHGIPTNHSRDSSLAEETVDGYVPMAPNPTDDGYVDMEPLSGHRFHGEDCQHSDMSPGSSCSFTSGTPSTDLRFSEYHLEKVSSYLTPSEEDELSLAERPSRTYSFGSQSETTKSKGKIEVLNSADSGRVRAFSVGSKWGRPRNLTKETHKVPSRSHVLPQSSKSSSTPLLSSSWSGTSRHAQSLNDPMADLMEIDFTENKKKKKSTSSSKFRVAPVIESSSQLSVDMKGFHTVTSSADSGYMDMSSKSPSGIFHSTKTQNGSEMYSASPPSVVSGSPKTQGFSAIFEKSPPKSSLSGGFDGASNKPFFSSTEMIRTEPKNTRPAKPAVVSSSTLKTIGEKPDVKPQKFPTTSSATLNMYALFNKLHASGNSSKSLDYMDMRLGNAENQQGKEVDQNYMEMGGKNVKKFARANSDKDLFSEKENRNKNLPEGYMEMSFGGKLTKKLSEEKMTASYSSEDYMPMSGGSQPIAIKSAAVVGLAPTERTPPKVPATFPGLGSTDSLNSSRRNGRRKNRKKHERRGSKEMVTTPTGSTSTIFPMSLSSPTSPKRKTNRLTELKERLTPTNSPTEESLQEELSPTDEDSLYEEMTPGVDLEEKCFLDAMAKPVVEKTDADMSRLSDSFERFLRVPQKNNSNDYVNYSPRCVIANDDDYGDYAYMEPTEFAKKRDGRKSKESETGIPFDVSYGVPFSATAYISDPKSDVAQRIKCPEKGDDLKVHRLASSQLSSCKTVGKTKPQSSKDNACCSVAEEKSPSGSHTRLTSSNLDGSGVGNSVAASNDRSHLEATDRKPESKTSDQLTGLTRQVSHSGSSSTEASVGSKEPGSSSPVPSYCVSGCCGSRPSSTSSEKNITYASLDLGPSGSEGEESGRSPRNFRGNPSAGDETSGYSLISTTPTAVPCESFNYVKIDFEKSGSLRAQESFGKKIHY